MEVMFITKYNQGVTVCVITEINHLSENINQSNMPMLFTYRKETHKSNKKEVYKRKL